MTKAAEIFNRYDLDASGTCNSVEEAEQMSMNLVFSLDLIKAPPECVPDLVLQLQDCEKNPVSLEVFWSLFKRSFGRFGPQGTGEMVLASLEAAFGIGTISDIDDDAFDDDDD